MTLRELPTTTLRIAAAGTFLMYDSATCAAGPAESTMKGLQTIVLSIVAILSSLFCLLSSICFVSSRATSDQVIFGVFALVGLAVAGGAVVWIVRINRKQNET